MTLPDEYVSQCRTVPLSPRQIKAGVNWGRNLKYPADIRFLVLLIGKYLW